MVGNSVRSQCSTVLSLDYLLKDFMVVGVHGRARVVTNRMIVNTFGTRGVSVLVMLRYLRSERDVRERDGPLWRDGMSGLGGGLLSLGPKGAWLKEGVSLVGELIMSRVSFQKRVEFGNLNTNSVQWHLPGRKRSTTLRVCR